MRRDGGDKPPFHFPCHLQSISTCKYCQVTLTCLPIPTTHEYTPPPCSFPTPCDPYSSAKVYQSAKWLKLTYFPLKCLKMGFKGIKTLKKQILTWLKLSWNAWKLKKKKKIQVIHECLQTNTLLLMLPTVPSLKGLNTILSLWVSERTIS